MLNHRLLRAILFLSLPLLSLAFSGALVGFWNSFWGLLGNVVCHIPILKWIFCGCPCVHGRCPFEDDECYCDPNWAGEICDECAEGFTGSLCNENIDDCTDPNLCENGGICVDDVADYSCSCQEDWTGFYCRLDADIEEAQLQGNDEFDESFGKDVAMDQNTIAVANKDTVFIFVKSGTTWTKQHEIVEPSDEEDFSFGYKLAITGDSLFVAAGSGGKSNKALVYLFQRSGSAWSQQGAVLVEGLNLILSIAANGNTAMVGVDFIPSRGDHKNAVIVFTNSGTGWMQQDVIISPLSQSNFGEEIAIIGDTAAISAPPFRPRKESVSYLYTRLGETWTETWTNQVEASRQYAAFDGETLVLYNWHENYVQMWTAFSNATWTKDATIYLSDVEDSARSVQFAAISGDYLIVKAKSCSLDVITSCKYYWYLFSRSGNSTWTVHDKFSTTYGDDQCAIVGNTAVIRTIDPSSVSRDFDRKRVTILDLTKI